MRRMISCFVSREVRSMGFRCHCSIWYALLNGGAPYVIRDGAYPNFDGSFEPDVKLTLDQDIERCKVVSELHEKVAKCEMVRHEMVGGDYEVQRTVFSDGTVVTVDFRNQVYEITR